MYNVILLQEGVADAEEMIVPMELAEVDSISALIRARLEEMAEKAKLEAQQAEAAEEDEDEDGKKAARPDADQDDVK